MIENYMDYSKEECMNMFSQGQINMMRSMLEGPRAELIGLPASVGSVEKNGFFVFPNPTGNELNFNYESLDQYEIAIIDILGKTVYNGHSDVSRIDVSGLNNGVYFLQVMGEHQAFSTRFTIQK
jgi:hypothetical protein